MRGQPPVAPTLELIGKAAAGRMYELGNGILRIGRDRSSDVCLEDRRVSSFHAQVLRRPDGTYYVEDLKSYNLTYLDGQPLPPYTPTPLRDGSRIKVCDFTFVFHREAVSVREGIGGDPTILGTLEDMSSLGLSSRSDRAATVLRAVLEINRQLGGATELNVVLGRALEELFAIFRQAECGFIITREPDGKLVPWATRHRQNPGASLSLSRTVLHRVLREKEGLILSDSDSGVEVTESWSGAGIRTAMCVPILGHDGQAIGIIQLDSRVQKVVFGPEDLELLAAVAVPIGVVVENHRLLKEKAALAAAAEVQAGLLPHTRPAPPGYTFWEQYQPAMEVGGDYYDYIPVAPPGQPVGPGYARWAVAVGDVTGKGIPAALLVASLGAEVRHLVRSGAGPVEVASAVNRDVFDAGITGKFITFLLATLDAEAHTLSVVSAGHPCPFIRRAGGAIERLGESVTRMPLGVDPQIAYMTAGTTLGPGDLVVLFTDGVTEAMGRNDAVFGIGRVEKVIASTPGGPAQVGDALFRAVRMHSAGRDQSDDIALVCFGRD